MKIRHFKNVTLAMFNINKNKRKLSFLLVPNLSRRKTERLSNFYSTSGLLEESLNRLNSEFLNISFEQ